MARPHDKPVAHITASGNGLSRAAGAVHWYLEYEGPQTVFVDDLGRVFAFPDGTLHAIAWLERRVAWLVGRYTNSRTPGSVQFRDLRAQLVGDLRERALELKQARAA